MIRTVRLHAHLFASLLVGAAVALLIPALPLAQRLIIGWDAACILFLLASLRRVLGADGADDIRRRAEQLDEGGRWVLPLSVLAALIALAAIAVEGSGADDKPPAMLIALMIGTLLLSWSVVQTLFALHYAHEFYGPAGKGKDRGGLLFPGTPAPDYWDFVHFAVVIGVAAQTADIQITARPQRRVATFHSLTAFVFNTVVVAMAVNLAVNLL